MVAERLEVRLDPERRRKLAEVAAQRGVPVSEAVRQMIDQAYEQTHRAERMRLVEELAQLEVEDMPDPEVLSRQLAERYGPADLH